MATFTGGAIRCNIPLIHVSQSDSDAHQIAAKNVRKLILAILFGAVTLLHAQEHVTVKTEDTGAALVNPGMGWTMHFYSNIPANYGSKLAPADTLDDFPGLSTVYLRLPWALIEPEEGKYNWAILDTPAQRWIASPCLFLAMTASTAIGWAPSRGITQILAIPDIHSPPCSRSSSLSQRY